MDIDYRDVQAIASCARYQRRREQLSTAIKPFIDLTRFLGYIGEIFTK